MKLSILIKELQALLNKEGDLKLETIFSSSFDDNARATFKNENDWSKEFEFISPVEK